jgi:hypothetical protein
MITATVVTSLIQRADWYVIRASLPESLCSQ